LWLELPLPNSEEVVELEEVLVEESVGVVEEVMVDSEMEEMVDTDGDGLHPSTSTATQ
jgi:hypothetical protein